MAVASRKIGKYSKWDDIDAAGEIEREMQQEIIDEIDRRIIMNAMAKATKIPKDRFTSWYFLDTSQLWQ